MLSNDPQLPEVAPPPPPREPAWSGPQLLAIVAFTGVAIVVAVFGLALIWAIGRRAAGLASMALSNPERITLGLIGQTVGLAMGFALAAAWISGDAPFWRAIHWRKLSRGQVGSIVLAGLATMLGIQALSHFLPIPTSVPMDQMFTPQTAWLLVIYGVGIAPFFEEFFFRGLLYPALQATFDRGLTADDQRHWRLPLQLLAAVCAIALLLWRLRETYLPPLAVMHIGLWIAFAVAVALVALPMIPIAAVGWLLNRIAGLRRSELAAILLTGLLFGLLHAAQLGWSWAAVLMLVLVGVLLTWARAATGSLMASWIYHCTYNGALFAAQYVATQGFHNFKLGPH